MRRDKKEAAKKKASRDQAEGGCNAVYCAIVAAKGTLLIGVPSAEVPAAAN